MLTYAILRGFYAKKEFRDGQFLVPKGRLVLNIDSAKRSPEDFLIPDQILRIKQLAPYLKRGLITRSPTFPVYVVYSSKESEIYDFHNEVAATIQDLFDMFHENRETFRREVSLKYTPRSTSSVREIIISHIVKTIFPRGKKILLPCNVVGRVGIDNITSYTGAYWGMPVRGQDPTVHQNKVIPLINEIVEIWLNSKFD